MSRDDEVRRIALRDAAHCLRLTADDYASMADKERVGAERETLSGRKQVRINKSQCLSEAAQLLRGQAERIERL